MWTVRGAKDWGSGLEAVSINSTIFSAFAVPALLRQLKGGIGATIAIWRHVLKEVGGFVAVADNVCDDGMLGSKVRQAGYKLFLSPYLIQIIVQRQRLSTYLRRYLRWLITIRHVYPFEYFATGLGFFGSLAAALYFIMDVSVMRGAVVAGNFLLRMGSAYLYNAFYIKDRATLKYSWLLPLWDFIIPFYWIKAWFRHTVFWRGHYYRLGPQGWILSSDS